MLPKVIHLEPTDVCNLACPLCARETDHEFNKQSAHHLSVDQLKSVISDNTIKQLDKMFMCGNYGDPAAGKHTLEIYQYFRSLNPSIVLGMNTNGALRTTEWWRNLASILNQPRDYVVFSIDGLEDTNSVYRVNSSWDTLRRNVVSFIEAGGTAHWDMLIYKHNEHQVDQCQKLAKDLGFKWFKAKVSKRPLINNLEYPITWKESVLQPSGQIDCHALREQSIYIDAQGRKSPCCWLGSRQSNFISDIEIVKKSWDTNPDPVCVSACSVQNIITNFEAQWRYEIEF